jgi:flagellar biosynthesis GTPase FlhF
MTQNPGTNPPAPGQTPPGGDPPGQTPPTIAPEQTPTQVQHPSTDHWTEADREYIKRLRKEAEDANDQAKALKRAAEATERARQEAEEAKRREKGEWEELAKGYKSKVDELTPLATRYQALSDLVNAQIEAQIKDWPTEIKAFDPGKDAPVETRQEWVNKSIPIITKLGQPAPGAPGNAPGPKPAGAAGNKKDVDELRERYRATRGPLF